MTFHVEHVPLIPLPSIHSLVRSSHASETLSVTVGAVAVDDKERKEVENGLKPTVGKHIRFTLLKSQDGGKRVECAVYSKKVKRE